MTLLKPDFISSTNLALGRKMRAPNTICWRDELYYLSYKNHSNHLSQLQNTNELYCESVCIFENVVSSFASILLSHALMDYMPEQIRF